VQDWPPGPGLPILIVPGPHGMKSRAFIVTALVVLLLGGLIAGAYAYDHSRDDLIAEGVTVGGVDVGGMRQAEAERVLRHELLSPLDRSLVVKREGRRFRLSAREARIAADIHGMAASAVERSREGSILARVWRGATDAKVHATLPAEITYSSAAVRRLVRRVQRTTDVAPVNAVLALDGAGPRVSPSKDGRKLDAERLREQVEQRMLDPNHRTVRAHVSVVRPKVTTESIAKTNPAVIVVDRKSFRLRLYTKLRLKKTYRIAVGQVGLETPAGLYHIQNKQIDPAWHVPDSEWAGKLRGKVIPSGDPKNPIKARWLGIFDGAGIHGTDAIASLGSAASHGCVRMAIPDVKELYDQVPVGAPIYIV
jgi:lipoprotein-anchoring transpeptidase ErfK/SrfK